MVIRRLFTLALLILWTMPAVAQSTLTVEPNRTELHETETLTLTVQGSMELSLDLGGLFDLNLSNLPSPDTEELEKSFKILSRNQQYSVHTVNGTMTGDITWTYHLSPLSSGELEIPPLTFNDATSDAHTITVKPGAPTTNGAGERPAFIELATDKDSVYVQEQLILTVRLFFSGNLLRGELSEPHHANALIESLGKQREFRRFRDGREYRVVERRYAIFPQQAGDFALDPIEFQGQVRDGSGRLQFLKDSAPFFDVPVKAPPASFSGKTWLPASSLTLTESGIPDALSLQRSDSVTRTLTLTAEGLTAEALPPLNITGTDALKSYPEQPQRTTVPNSDGLTGTLVAESALVGVTPGDTVLPEIRIPWWDINEDREKVAIIPAQTITIAASTPAHGPTESEPVTTSNTDLTSNSADPALLPTTGNIWLWVAVAMGAGWLITVLLWARQRKNPTTEAISKPGRKKEPLFADVMAAAEKGDVRLLDQLPRWLNQRVTDTRFNSVNDVLRWAGDDDLSAEIRRLEQRTFGADQQEAASLWDGHKLIAALKRLSARKPKRISARAELLPPLYPDTLTDRH